MAGGSKNTSLLVRSQLPEFVAEDYPKFVEFLQAYYKFQAENYNVAIEKLRDPDAVSDELLIFLRKELIKNFPKSSIDDRKLIGLMRQLYSQKGTVDGIKLLFQLFFNDIIVIHKPGEQILRASQSNWDQYNIITLSTIYWDKVIRDLRRAAVGTTVESGRFNEVSGGFKIGDISHNGALSTDDSVILGKWVKNPYYPGVTQTHRDHIENILIPALLTNSNFTPYYRYSTATPENIIPGVTKLVVNNKNGRFSPAISKFEFAENRDIRIYFSSYERIIVDNYETVTLSGITGINKVVPSPSNLIINKPGKFWQKGQVIRIPGSVKDTVAKVTEITSYSTLKKVKASGNAGEYTLTVNDPIDLKVDLKVFIGTYFAGIITAIDGAVITLDTELPQTIVSKITTFEVKKIVRYAFSSSEFEVWSPYYVTKYDGGIKKIQIIEYGGAHDDNQSVVISPYPDKPVNNVNYDVDSVVVALDGTTPIYKHTLTIEDQIEHIAEIIYADKGRINFNKLAAGIIQASQGNAAALALFNIIVDGAKLGDINKNGSIQSYDASIVTQYANYLKGTTSTTTITEANKTRITAHVIPKLLELYEYHTDNPSVPAAYKDLLFGIVVPAFPVISQSYNEKNSTRRNSAEVTMAEWVESRATLTFQKSAIVRDVGSYRTDAGLLSNSDSKLQDNYFYQLFSYVIETTKSGDEVQYVLDQFHPAGMKYFFKLYKKTEYSMRDILESYRKFSSDVIFTTSILPIPTDSKAMTFVKPLTLDDVVLADALAKVFTKILASAATMADSVTKNFTKASTSTLNVPTDVATKTATKVSTSTLNVPTDVVNFKNTTKVLASTQSLVDATSIVSTKYITNETVDIASLDNATVDRNVYSDGYFAESYTQIVTTLSIG